MSAQAVRLWLQLSQILLAAGVLAVIVGAAGTIILGSARERLTLAAFAARPAPPPRPLPTARPDETVVALRAANADLTARLAAAEAAQAADARQLAEHAGAPTPAKPAAGALVPLTPAREARLVAALKAVPGPPQIHVVIVSDPAAAAYGESLVKAFEAAGYRGQLQKGAVLTPPLHGIHLTIAPTSTRGAAIKYALQAVGVPVIVDEGNPGAFDAFIAVGAP